MPTILDLAGIPSDKVSETAPAFPGRSLVPAFAKDNSVQHDFIFYHHEGNRGLRVGDYKLVSAKDNSSAWELYDMSKDRSEDHNLATLQPDKAKELQDRWDQLEAQYAKDVAR